MIQLSEFRCKCKKYEPTRYLVPTTYHACMSVNKSNSAYLRFANKTYERKDGQNHSV